MTAASCGTHNRGPAQGSCGGATVDRTAYRSVRKSVCIPSVSETGVTCNSPSAPLYVPVPPVMDPAYAALLPRNNERLPGDLPVGEPECSDALGLLAHDGHGRAHRALVPNLLPATHQFLGEHDLVTKRGAASARINKAHLRDEGIRPDCALIVGIIR